MPTVRSVINQLSELDPDEVIIFQYWSADDFDSKPSQRQFAKVIDNLWADALWEDAYETISDEIQAQEAN